jgi:membrane-bound lytic murein transglycosylase A
MTHILRALASLLAVILAACAGTPAPKCPQCPAVPAPRTEVRYEPVSFDAIPGWQSAALAPGMTAFVRGCARISPGNPLHRACEAARRIAVDDEAAARRFVEEAFAAWALQTQEGPAEGLVTGYYEPILAGSRTRTDRFRFPAYGVPPDLVAVDLESLHPELRHLRLRGRVEGSRLVPYWNRNQIDTHPEFRAPILAWVENPVELFFLQIQGSGQVALESGERLRLGYAEQNGHPYRSIGRYLVDRGEMALERASMQGIKAWAAANPEKLRAALDSNPSYVFFRELPAPSGAPGGAGDGPPGTLGVPLTAGYSVAVDPRSVPLGAPVFLATTWPLSTRPLERLMAAQDTGGAIRGAARADFYWGTGDEAGKLAGQMRQRGRMWILWPRGQPLQPSLPLP